MGPSRYDNFLVFISKICQYRVYKFADANNIPIPIDTIVKSINYATNLSVKLANITSIG
jgi:hypothetical protein